MTKIPFAFFPPNPHPRLGGPLLPRLKYRPPYTHLFPSYSEPEGGGRGEQPRVLGGAVVTHSAGLERAVRRPVCL